tara:strand:+ start:441 stop:941 length:501 start_codon:yes stop_codon:yes gene_type:complete
MKKGQLMGQPLVFIFYLVAASLILVFGIKAFAYLKCYDDEVEYYDFIRRFENKINTINNDAVGSKMSLKDLHVPNRFQEMCFFYNSEGLDQIQSEKLRLLIQASVTQVDGPNMFIYSPESCSGFEVMAEKIDDLNIGENFCEQLSDGMFNVVIESIPGEVNISKSI